MQLFFNTVLTDRSKAINFSKEESKHIAKVLRKKEGDCLSITNGKGALFTARITLSTPNKCQATITAMQHFEARKYQLHMVVAPTKMNDRYEWFLEKATEIGVTEITPIICDHSERKIIKPDRFRRIIQGAMKQSLQYYEPILNDAISFKDFVASKRDHHVYIAHCEETKKQSLKSVLQPQQNCTILIGPEGDFSNAEIEMALKSGFLPVTLGSTRLRTETAAIAAVHSVAYVN